MENIKDIFSKYGFAALIILLGIILLAIAGSSGQNTLVIIGVITIILCAALIALNNSGVIPVKFTVIFVSVLILCSISFTWLDYDSVQNKIEFMAEQDKREARVVKRLIDIRSAQVSYKNLYGEYADNFDKLISHVMNDSMPVVKAIGFVPDTLTEAKAVELGIVTRDTLLISVRDTLFPSNYAVDSLRFVPNSKGGEFTLQAGEIEKNRLKVKVFEAFASNDKMLLGMDFSEEYIDMSEGLRVGSMTEPHTRGNWE
jgi:hypothetical protein